MMMLHERLKKMSDGCSCEEPREALNFTVDDDYESRECAWCSKAALEAIANEIERTYIPLPIDVDGNPWREGEECEVIMSGKQGAVIGYARQKIAVIFSDASVVWYRPFEIKRIERDTLERINDDASMNPREYYNEHIGHDVGLKDDEQVTTAFVRDLLKRQREVLECGE